MADDPLAIVDALREPLLMTDEEEATAATPVRPTTENAKGGYNPILQDETGDGILENVDDDVQSIPSTPVPWWQSALLRNWFPDAPLTLWSVPLLDGPVAVKLLKLEAVAYVGIVLFYYIVRFVGWENDHKYFLKDFWMYESNLVATDVIVFFFVGRLHQQRGVDHLAWLGTVLLSNVYASWITDVPFLRHSFTLYEMHCTWSWKLWAFCVTLVPLVCGIVLAHIYHAMQSGGFVRKLSELGLATLLFLVPLLTSPYFHFHHWFLGWLVGMHANVDTWWSRTSMAWCFGLYINGIAVYGRDPVLTCGYAYYLSVDQRCPFVDCYLDYVERASASPAPLGGPTPAPIIAMVRPNWRNCSATAYHR